MFTVKIRLVVDDWHKHSFHTDNTNEVLAYVTTIRKLKEYTYIKTLDFIPLGNGEYIIWGQGKCQGYMAIKEVGPETSEPDSESGP